MNFTLHYAKRITKIEVCEVANRSRTLIDRLTKPGYKSQFGLASLTIVSSLSNTPKSFNQNLSYKPQIAKAVILEKNT